ncbi:diguanylate cyclase [Azorhizobium caulinodans]|uniref:GGDEF domain-containing protein n=1 Tax=Azorhizobium caulinodans TaxID=7 RepID=UPI002FBE4450
MTQTPPSQPDQLPKDAVPPSATRWIIPGGLLIVLLVAVLTTVSLWEARQNALGNEQRQIGDLVLITSQDIQRHYELYDLLLREAAAQIVDLPPSRGTGAPANIIRRTMDASRIPAEMILISESGKLVASSRHPTNGEQAADRDYFIIQRDQPATGLYLSRPFRNRLDQEPCVALSRRLTDSHGNFAGILAILVPLQSVREMFASLTRHRSDAISLIRLDGTILVRQPDLGSFGGFGLNVFGRPNFQRMATAPQGSFTSTSEIDRVKRYYVFSRVGDLPLIVVVGVGMDAVTAPWQAQWLAGAATSVVLCLLILGAAVALRREMLRRFEIEQEFLRLSQTDSLTGLPNRRHFDEFGQREWQRAARQRSSIAVLMVDIDHFKQVNDRIGHPGGDRVLREVSDIIRASLHRPGDFAGRYGGEEFAIILPETDAPAAAHVAERIRAAIETNTAEGVAPVTVSIGLAAALAAPKGTLAEMMIAADHALYRAKETGRNRVVSSHVARNDNLRPLAC